MREDQVFGVVASAALLIWLLGRGKSRRSAPPPAGRGDALALIAAASSTP